MDITPSTSLIAALARFTDQNAVKTDDGKEKDKHATVQVGSGPDPESRGPAVDISANTLTAAGLQELNQSIEARRPNAPVPVPQAAPTKPATNTQFLREAPTPRDNQRHVLPGSILDIKV